MSPPRLSSGRPWEVINDRSTGRTPPPPVEKHAHPTVLVAVEDKDLRGGLVFNLRQLGCLVLEAELATRAIEVVISHSRPIQVLLGDKNLDDVGLLETLKRYRPQMQILVVARDSNGSRPDWLTMDAAVAKTKELLDLPKRGAAAT